MYIGKRYGQLSLNKHNALCKYNVTQYVVKSPVLPISGFITGTHVPYVYQLVYALIDRITSNMSINDTRKLYTW